MARMVTGSVAESVDPNARHSTIPSSSPSSPKNEYMYTSTLYCMWLNVWMNRQKRMNTPYSNCGYECSQESEYEDGTEIAKEVFLEISV